MWLPDVTGPDGIRVTLRVEPAVAKVSRTADRWALTPGILMWFPKLRRGVTRGVQTDVLGDQWVVDVESDGGAKARPSAASKVEAQALAEQISAAVAEHGEAAVAAYR